MIKAWGLPTFPVSFWQTLSKTFTLVTTTDFISRKQHQSAVMSSSQERALQPVTFLASARLTQFLKCQAAEITPAADVRRRWAGFTQSSWATHSYTQPSGAAAALQMHRTSELHEWLWSSAGPYSTVLQCPAPVAELELSRSRQRHGGVAEREMQIRLLRHQAARCSDRYSTFCLKLSQPCSKPKAERLLKTHSTISTDFWTYSFLYIFFLISLTLRASETTRGTWDGFPAVPAPQSLQGPTWCLLTASTVIDVLWNLNCCTKHVLCMN